jgi:bacillithiol biosynthesis deacetylase BshB1
MTSAVELDILAMAAHPDDVEITSGGLLIKMGNRGRKVGVLDLTRGEMGTLGNEHDRDREAAAAAKIMGLTFRQNLGLPDSGLHYTQENRLKIAAVIRATKPELVILPHWEQRHPDHRICMQLGFDACFFAGLKKLGIPGETHRPRKIIYASYYRNNDSSFLVDISDEFERKCEAVAAYHSQFGDRELSKIVFQPETDVFELMRHRAAALGHKVGVKYAEDYSIKEQILVDDPQKMPVRSI